MTAQPPRPAATSAGGSDRGSDRGADPARRAAARGPARALAGLALLGLLALPALLGLLPASVLAAQEGQAAQAGRGNPGGKKRPTATPAPTPIAAPTATPGGSGADPVLVAAGDVASCGSTGDEATAALLDGIFAGVQDGVVAALGDLAYESGTSAEFGNCYHPTWGRHKGRTRPAPGNHEYQTAGAAGYFGYFGGAAGDPTRGYYSYELGTWHVVALNSNCGSVGGCGAGSAQEQWLRADLAAHRVPCTLAYWHHPRFSSGPHGDLASVQPLWQALWDYNADVVLSGHDHLYERFAPQNPAGNADPLRGIREFVVGTGGRSHYAVEAVRPNSEVRNGDTYGVLRLTLRPGRYDWRFVPEAGKTFADAGSGQACH